MTNISDQNWRIKFWDMWEAWEDGRQENILRVFQSPVRYMHWAEQTNSELKYFTPWEFAQQYGANSLMDYLYYLANRDYWDQACAEFKAKQVGNRLGVVAKP